MDYRPKILELAKTGPLLPTGVAKELATNSLMAGAMLSEMCDKGMLKTSALRVGGSPLYLIPGNEAQLLNHLSSLNEKDRRTVVLLQDKQVLCDKEVDPLIRVSLGQIKDFAKPVIIEYNGKEEKFWKWFALSDDLAKEGIAKILDEQKKREQQSIPEKVQEVLVQKVESEIAPLKREIFKSQGMVSEKKEESVQQVSVQKSEVGQGEFAQILEKFFQKNSVVQKEKQVVKKKTEFDLVIQLQSAMGSLTYACKARSKKVITDADVNAAFVCGQLKKLPVILLTDGVPTKKAKELAEKLGIGITRV